MNNATITALAALSLCGMNLIPKPASAMPISGLAGLASQLSTGIQTVGWGCNPNRCSWRPNYPNIRIIGHWGAQAPWWQIPLPIYSYSGPRFYGYSYGPEISFDFPNLPLDAHSRRWR